MTFYRRVNSGIVLFIAAAMLFSCDLEDFNLRKLANPNYIVPDVFAPLAYGTFTVSELVPAGSIPGTYQIPTNGRRLEPMLLSKSGTSFSSTAIDSVYLITHITNNTPCDMEFELSFADASGIQLAQPFPSGKISAGSVDQKIEFPLDTVDQDRLQSSAYIKLLFKISSPAGGNLITYDLVRLSSFTVKISFHAPVKLREL